MQQDPENM
jgi:hypothetical protein